MSQENRTEIARKIIELSCRHSALIDYCLGNGQGKLGKRILLKILSLYIILKIFLSKWYIASFVRLSKLRDVKKVYTWWSVISIGFTSISSWSNKKYRDRYISNAKILYRLQLLFSVFEYFEFVNSFLVDGGNDDVIEYFLKRVNRKKDELKVRCLF